MDPLPRRVRGALDDFAAEVREKLGKDVLELRLFGSWATGRSRAESDVDVLVVVRERSEAVRHVPYEAAISALLAHGTVIAPLVMDEDEWRRAVASERRLARDIAAEGRAL